MELRDYFMAHAPAKPQPWFEPKMPPRPESPPYGPSVDPVVSAVLGEYMPTADPEDWAKRVYFERGLEQVRAGDDWTEEDDQPYKKLDALFMDATGRVMGREDIATVATFIMQCAEWRKLRTNTLEAQLAWDAERDKQRFVQWPRAWANEQMKERER